MPGVGRPTVCDTAACGPPAARGSWNTVCVSGRSPGRREGVHRGQQPLPPSQGGRPGLSRPRGEREASASASAGGARTSARPREHAPPHVAGGCADATGRPAEARAAQEAGAHAWRGEGVGKGWAHVAAGGAGAVGGG
ncbi:hypothetical protein VULLAG_LOCUS21458 [Vulpes lagopus]